MIRENKLILVAWICSGLLNGGAVYLLKGDSPAPPPSSVSSFPLREQPDFHENRRLAEAHADALRKGIQMGFLVGQSGRPLAPYMIDVEAGWKEILDKNYPQP